MTDRTTHVLERLHEAERDALFALKKALAAEFGADFLGLRFFGSRARGERCGWSACPQHNPAESYEDFTDLDVVIFLRELSEEKWRRASRTAFHVDLEYDVLFDVKYETPGSWAEGLDRELLFYQEVEREGVPI